MTIALDLFGAKRLVGKSLGTDLATGKLTLPVLNRAGAANAPTAPVAGID